MPRPVAFILVVLLAIGAQPVSGQPSFDCEKATTDVEKWICSDDGPITGGGSQWLDRQLARLYTMALTRAPAEERSRLLISQRRFLHVRDVCFARRGCRIEDVYRRRLREIAHLVDVKDAFATFQGVEGELQIARFGKTAAISIAASHGEYACQFESEELPISDDGAVHYRKSEWECRIDVMPAGDSAKVETDGVCYCGAHATMDGIYVRAD